MKAAPMTMILGIVPFVVLLMIITPIVYSTCDYYYIYGVVNSAADGTSSIGRTAKVYIPDDESRFTTCPIGPGHPTFVCDVCRIPGFDLRGADGTNVSARILDPGDGYVAGPVNATIYSDGADSDAPDMTLARAIQFESPVDGGRYTTSPSLVVDALYPYHQRLFYQTDNGPMSQFCENCDTINAQLDLPIGTHRITVQGEAFDGQQTSRSVTFRITPGGSPIFVKMTMKVIDSQGP